MGISCVLFVILASITGNMDEEYEARKMTERGRFQLELDYELNDEAYPENNLDQILKKNPFQDSFLDQIKKIDGVTNVETRDVLAVKCRGWPAMLSYMTKLILTEKRKRAEKQEA